MEPNHLIHEKSPYLLQHAYNPVDWYPWGEEAFARARDLNRPIFLSIGYATCHWCHVMERESFEDHDVAKAMNRCFVSIKLDREELPEVDRLYMEFAQGMISGPAGWPLNLILTPELHPFFAFTYAPPRTTATAVGLIDLIEKIEEIWNGPDREKIFLEMKKVVELFAKSIRTRGERIPDESVVGETASMLYKIADPIYGGIKGAPKFPAPHQMRFLLNYIYSKSDSRALFIVEKTLDGMASGGIYDHLGGGFCRYSTDEAWLIPHFEKMLCDNAQLALLYLDGWKLTGKRAYADICRQTLDYITRDMRNAEGGFYSAEDAESAGEEGGFYTWTKKEIFALFNEEDATLLCDFFGVTEAGNFEGKNVLSLPQDALYFAEEKGMSFPELESRIQILKRRLWEARERRERPFRDDKVLASWNGLAINAFSLAGATFGQSYYLEHAVLCARFLKKFLWKENTLWRRWIEGEVKFIGNLEDYAFLIKGLLSLFEAGCGTEWLEWALELAAVLEKRFKSAKGAFFQIEEGASHCLLRLCAFSDGSEPSGNAIHCENLMRLYQITSDPHFFDQACDILSAANKYLDAYSPAYAYHALNLLRFYDRTAPTVVVSLNQNKDYHREIFDLLYARFRPHLSIVWKQEGEEKLPFIIPSVKAHCCQKNQTTVYICRQGVCEKPLTDIEEIRQILFSL